MPPTVLGFDVSNDGWSGSDLLPALIQQEAWQPRASFANGNRLLRADGQPLTSLQARFALQARGKSVRPGSLLKLLENIGSSDTEVFHRESWLEIFQDLSKQERMETQDHVKGINYQIDCGFQPGFNTTHGLSGEELCKSHPILLLEAIPPGSSDDEAVSTPLQFPEAAMQSFQRHWNADSLSKPCIFAVIDPSASANEFFEQLKVSDPTLLKAELQKCNTTWRGGRVAYIGVMIFDDTQKSAIEELVKATEPPVEPVLSLIINVDGMPHHHQMMLPLFMHNVHKPEVQLTNSSSGRNLVKHLVDDVKRDLVQAKIQVARDAKFGLCQLCLQCREDIHSSSLTVKELDESKMLADLFQVKDLERAFKYDDDDDNALDSDGLSSSEAKTWLATLYIEDGVVTEDPTASDDKSEDMATMHQSIVESKACQLPVVSSSQAAVANEIILRILISKGFLDNKSPDNFKRGLDRFREAYKDGLDFIVLVPIFVTLWHQTLQRLQDAELKNSDGSDPRVLPYTFAADTTEAFKEFRSKVMHPDNEHKLFVMIVDEAHHSAKRHSAHDAFVNGLRWKIGKGEPMCGPWQKGAEEVPNAWPNNLITLLVSATPYNAMTADSRVPRQYYVPHESVSGLASELHLQQYSCIKSRDEGYHPKTLNQTEWACDNKYIPTDDLRRLLREKVVRELHIIDWKDVQAANMPYRSISNYVASSTKARSIHHGISSDDTFHQRVQGLSIRKVRKGKKEARGGKVQSQEANDVPLDILLALDYVISMQYFRIFRWNKSELRLLSCEESSKLLWAQPATGKSAMQEFLDGLILEVFKASEYLPAVLAMLKHPIKAAFDPDCSNSPDGAFDHWLRAAYDEIKSLPPWPAVFADAPEKWSDFSRSALKVWIDCKLKAEQQSHVVGQHSTDSDRQFTETDRLIKSLLQAKVHLSAVGSEAPVARGSTLDMAQPVNGPMIVIRSSQGMGEKMVTILQRYLQHTKEQEIQWQHKPAQGLPSWQLFDIVGDLGENVQQEDLGFVQVLLCRPMSPDHPHRDVPGFEAYWQGHQRLPSLQCYMDYIHAQQKAAAIANPGTKRRKPAGLQYSDLYGVPVILVLCEKGRMGDTFPHTFTCQDQRLRSGDMLSTFVQELGRLCRYPSVLPQAYDISLSTAVADGLGNNDEQRRLSILKRALDAAFGTGSWQEPTGWADMVHQVAAAASQSLQALVKGLNNQVLLAKGARSQHGAIVQEYAAVQLLPEFTVPDRHGVSLRDTSDQFAERLQEGQNPRNVLEQWVKALKAWRERILTTCDGSGFVLGDAKMPHFQQLLPVRIMVNDKFVKDCLDSNDLVELFCCCHTDSVVIRPAATVTLLRHRHPLPYALMACETAQQLRRIQEATQLKIEGATGRALGNLSIASLSEDVMENWSTGSKVDRYMSYTKAGLRGAAVHDYREAAKAHGEHYDTGRKQDKHVQPGRFLLKAQPQQGKTGAYIGLLQQLGTILQPVDPWQPTPGVPDPSASAPAKKWHDPMAVVQWQNSCFIDLTGEWPPHERLLSGKYAIRVACQRLILLASACLDASKAEPWPKKYIQLLLGVHGENICTKVGRKIAGNVLQHLMLYHAKHPVPISSADGQDGIDLAIVNLELVEEAINWDDRVEEASQALLSASAPEDLLGGILRCAKGSDGLLHVQVKDGWCIQAIKSCFANGNAGQVFNLVQQIGWGHSAFAHPDPASDGSDIGDCPGSWSSQTAQTSRQLHPEGNMAYPMRVGRILRPVPAIEASSPVELEPRCPDLGMTRPQEEKLFPAKQEGSIPSVHGPVFLATPAVWRKLVQCSVDSSVKCTSQADRFSLQEQPAAVKGFPAATVHNWIFVPSYNRYADSNPHQMRIDWADAMSQDTQFVRVIVVRSDKQQVLGYSKLLLEHQTQVEKHLKHAPQVTLLMVMPHTIDLKYLPGECDLKSYQRTQLNEAMGIGFSRLCIQLISKLMGLPSVWVLDDNISDCWRLPFEAFVSSGGTHGSLQSVKLDQVMKTIENQVLASKFESTTFSSAEEVCEGLRNQMVAETVQGTRCASRGGPLEMSPRSRAAQEEGAQLLVDNVAELTGHYSKYGVIAISSNIKGALQVGLTGKGNVGPWNVTPSAYSMILLNVASTVERGALYPAKPYHEDVDFAHLCEERQLVVVKCNWLYFHKARLSGPYICKWITGRGKPGSSLTLEDPGDGVLRPGQIICIKAPTKRGRPIHMVLQKHEAALPEAAVRFVSSDAAGMSVYALCVTIPIPAGEDSVRGQLRIDFEDGNGSTAQEVTLTGLFGWGTSQYFAPTELSPNHVLSGLANTSRAMQLQLVMQHVGGACVDPLKICASLDDLSRNVGFAVRTDQYDGQLSKQPVVWLQNSSLFSQKDTELRYILLHLAAYAEGGILLQGSTDHYLVMSYSRANAKTTFDEVVSACARESPSFKVKAVYTTVQPSSVSSALLPCALDSSLPYMLVVFRYHASVVEEMQISPTQAGTDGVAPAAPRKVSKPASGAVRSTGKRPSEASSDVPPTKKRAAEVGSHVRAVAAVPKDGIAARPDTTQVDRPQMDVPPSPGSPVKKKRKVHKQGSEDMLHANPLTSSSSRAGPSIEPIVIDGVEPQGTEVVEANQDAAVNKVSKSHPAAPLATMAKAPGLDDEDGGSPTNKKGSPWARREGRKGKQGGADGEPGAAVPGATVRMSEWPPNDQEDGQGGSEVWPGSCSRRDANLFVRGVKRFGTIDRLPDIAAEIGPSFDNICNAARVALWNGLLRHCNQACKMFADGHHPDLNTKEPILDFFGVPVKAEDVPQQVERMYLLKKKVEAFPEPQCNLKLDFQLSIPKWGTGCGWSPGDDAMLLLGVHWHGLAHWEDIAADERLGLAEKLQLARTEKKGRAQAVQIDGAPVILPTGAHLETRVLALLKKLQTATQMPPVGEPKSKQSRLTATSGAKGKARKRGPDADAEGFADDMGGTAKGPKTESAGFEQILSPVMEEVKKLRTLQRKGNEMEKNKVVEKTHKYLRVVGDHIQGLPGRQAGSERKIWSFVSVFSENKMDGDKLQTLYVKLKASKAPPSGVPISGVGGNTVGARSGADGEGDAATSRHASAPPHRSRDSPSKQDAPM